MNVDDLTTQLREEREGLIEGIEIARKQRQVLNTQIKQMATELARVERLVRAAEGRKRGSQ